MRSGIILVLAMFCAGCITTYRDFPVDSVGVPPKSGSCAAMEYRVGRFDILDAGGYEALRSSLRRSRLCREMHYADGRPSKGLFLDIETRWKPLSVPALVFGYLSLSTLTLLPAWSTQDGYDVRYVVYLDGEKKATYQYDISRTMVLWAGLLPFVWANALTYGEAEAFEATVSRFSLDARSFLDGTETVPQPQGGGAH